MDEYPLRGGSVNTVVRAGDTVRRRPGGRFVHELLGFFERSGWGGAPRFLGLDEQGREILSFVEGYVPWQEPGMPGVTAETSLVRWPNSPASSTTSPQARRWPGTPRSCATTTWQYLGLGPGALVGPTARGIRLICDAYRLDERNEIVGVIMWWQDRCWRGIQAGAVAGDPAMVRLRNDGAVLEVQAAFRWVAIHRAELEFL